MQARLADQYDAATAMDSKMHSRARRHGSERNCADYCVP